MYRDALRDGDADMLAVLEILPAAHSASMPTDMLDELRSERLETTNPNLGAELSRLNLIVNDLERTAFTARSEMEQAVTEAASLAPKPDFVEVEATNLDQVSQLLTVTGVDVILLDNFAVDAVRAAVELRDTFDPRPRIEFDVSGGVTLDTIRAMAETGVERISVGAITHSAPALDLSLQRVGP